MTLMDPSTLHDPFTLLPALQRELNRTLDTFWGRAPARAWGGDGAPEGWLPALDLRETADAYLLKVDLPGIRPEEVQITVEGDELRIRGETVKEEVTSGETWHRRERHKGSFLRTLHLPSLDAQKVKATFKDGVLEVKAAKREERKSRTVKVDLGS